MLAEMIYGHFTIRQAYFHLTAWKTMETSPFVIIGALFLFLFGGICFYLIKHPLFLLKPHISTQAYFILKTHELTLSLCSSLLAASLGILMISGVDTLANQKWNSIKQFWLSMREYDTIIDENYANPANFVFYNRKPKNVVLIFAESLERTFFDNQVFGENLLPNLAKKEIGLSFVGHETLSEADWTSSAMVATLCGVTAKLYMPPRQLSDKVMCVSDIMLKSGYNTYYIQGSSLQFMNEKIFLKNHGFQKLEDVNSFPNNMRAYNINGIGDIINDDVLFERFQKQLLDFASLKKPFFAVAATINTHPFNGYLEKRCDRKYGDMRDVILCSDQTLADFVHWFKKQNFAKNTVLLILGDHLMMYNNMSNILKHSTHRETLNLLLCKECKNKGIIFKPFTQLDWAPTILQYAGFEWQNQHFGLGVSLFADDLNLLQRYGVELDRRLQRQSILYDKILYPK